MWIWADKRDTEGIRIWKIWKIILKWKILLNFIISRKKFTRHRQPTFDSNFSLSLSRYMKKIMIKFDTKKIMRIFLYFFINFLNFSTTFQKKSFSSITLILFLDKKFSFQFSSIKWIFCSTDSNVWRYTKTRLSYLMKFHRGIEATLLNTIQGAIVYKFWQFLTSYAPMIVRNELFAIF
jgi:hypothetical protein